MQKVKPYLYLHILMFMYSLGGICSKFAGQAEFLSLQFIVLYGLVLLNLFVYAIFWQQILKRLPLVTAYSNKAVTVIWGILWGFLFFGEPVTWKKLAGSLIIIAGVYFVVSDQGQTDTPLQNQASE